MDDPMIRSRLGRINGTRPFGGSRSQARAPLFLLRRISADLSPYRSISTLRIASMFRVIFTATIVQGRAFRRKWCIFASYHLRLLGIFDAAEHRDSGLAQNVFDDGFAEAGSVVVKH